LEGVLDRDPHNYHANAWLAYLQTKYMTPEQLKQRKKRQKQIQKDNNFTPIDFEWRIAAELQLDREGDWITTAKKVLEVDPYNLIAHEFLKNINEVIAEREIQINLMKFQEAYDSDDIIAYAKLYDDPNLSWDDYRKTEVTEQVNDIKKRFNVISEAKMLEYEELLSIDKNHKQYIENMRNLSYCIEILDLNAEQKTKIYEKMWNTMSDNIVSIYEKWSLNKAYKITTMYKFQTTKLLQTYNKLYELNNDLSDVNDVVNDYDKLDKNLIGEIDTSLFPKLMNLLGVASKIKKAISDKQFDTIKELFTKINIEEHAQGMYIHQIIENILDSKNGEKIFLAAEIIKHYNSLWSYEWILQDIRKVRFKWISIEHPALINNMNSEIKNGDIIFDKKAWYWAIGIKSKTFAEIYKSASYFGIVKIWNILWGFELNIEKHIWEEFKTNNNDVFKHNSILYKDAISDSMSEINKDSYQYFIENCKQQSRDKTKEYLTTQTISIISSNKYKTITVQNESEIKSMLIYHIIESMSVDNISKELKNIYKNYENINKRVFELILDKIDNSNKTESEKQSLNIEIITKITPFPLNNNLKVDIDKLLSEYEKQFLDDAKIFDLETMKTTEQFLKSLTKIYQLIQTTNVEQIEQVLTKLATKIKVVEKINDLYAKNTTEWIKEAKLLLIELSGYINAEGYIWLDKFIDSFQVAIEQTEKDILKNSDFLVFTLDTLLKLPELSNYNLDNRSWKISKDGTLIDMDLNIENDISSKTSEYKQKLNNGSITVGDTALSSRDSGIWIDNLIKSLGDKKVISCISPEWKRYLKIQEQGLEAKHNLNNIENKRKNRLRKLFIKDVPITYLSLVKQYNKLESMKENKQYKEYKKSATKFIKDLNSFKSKNTLDHNIDKQLDWNISAIEKNLNFLEKNQKDIQYFNNHFMKQDAELDTRWHDVWDDGRRIISMSDGDTVINIPWHSDRLAWFENREVDRSMEQFGDWSLSTWTVPFLIKSNRFNKDMFSNMNLFTDKLRIEKYTSTFNVDFKITIQSVDFVK